MMALRADAQKELDELPTPAQLKERYPDTSRWDARLQAALHKRRPVLKRVLVAALTLVILTLGALAVSADFRKAVYTMIQKFLPIEMQAHVSSGRRTVGAASRMRYSDHYVPDRTLNVTMTQGYDNEMIHSLMPMLICNAREHLLLCGLFRNYNRHMDRVETFDNEHTVYERHVKIGDKPMQHLERVRYRRHVTGYMLVWENDGISHARLLERWSHWMSF